MKVNGSSSYPRTWLRWPVASSACGLESRTPGVACRSSHIKTSAEGHSPLNTSSLANYTSSSSPSSSSLSLSLTNTNSSSSVFSLSFTHSATNKKPHSYPHNSPPCALLPSSRSAATPQSRPLRTFSRTLRTLPRTPPALSPRPSSLSLPPPFPSLPSP